MLDNLRELEKPNHTLAADRKKLRPLKSDVGDISDSVWNIGDL